MTAGRTCAMRSAPGLGVGAPGAALDDPVQRAVVVGVVGIGGCKGLAQGGQLRGVGVGGRLVLKHVGDGVAQAQEPAELDVLG